MPIYKLKAACGLPFYFYYERPLLAGSGHSGGNWMNSRFGFLVHPCWMFKKYLKPLEISKLVDTDSIDFRQSSFYILRIRWERKFSKIPR